MSIFWTPDEDDQPTAGSWQSRSVGDEVARWIDQDAVHRASVVFGAFVHRVAARAVIVRRLPHRLLRPEIRHRRV